VDGPAAEVSTVADDEVVVHIGPEVRWYRGLLPDTEYHLDGIEVRTLPRPGGEHLATIATVNDVHFGETECGIIEGLDFGPILTADPGEPPYPAVMNEAAIAEIEDRHPDAVVVKGDLTADGRPEEFAAFQSHYEGAFGDKLRTVRGNHDAGHGQTFAAVPTQQVALAGVTVAILDTVIPGHHTGTLSDEQLDWLDELGAHSQTPVLVMGHHHPWDPSSHSRPDDYFGIHPDASEKLARVLGRQPTLVGYFAGHTHRNRVRHFRESPTTPIVEVASVKDFPGTWAEYRIYEGGIVQIHRRISSPDALRWTDKTRAMFNGAYVDYAFGKLKDRCFTVWTRP
jgi:3',5'-cyclic AMP phosphodiesterase CpdA